MKNNLLFLILLVSPLFVFSQNIGIDNTSPLMKLHITSTGDSLLLLENSDDLDLNVKTSMYFKTGTGTYPYTGGIKTIGTSSSTARLGLFSYASTSPNGLLERMSILDNGNVGVGTNTPTNKFTVEGNFLVNQGIKQFYVPTWAAGSGTIINGVFDGLGAGPQIRLQGISGAGFVDIGNDSMGNFVVETNGDVQRLIVEQSGNVGIGTTSPDALMDIEGGAFLAQGTTGSTPVSGAGTRMMWIPDKKAFRAGKVTGTQWDDGNIGQESFVGGGDSNTASGSQSFVGGGFSNTASGSRSFVGGGFYNTAGSYSFVAGGSSNTASGLRSFVGGGFNNTASGLRSFVGGGIENTASGQGSFVGGGYDQTASGTFSFVGGGSNLIAKSFAEAVFGHCNTDYTPFSPNGINSADRLFVIGNGTSTNARSNAMTVLKNGNIGIGIDIPTKKVDVVGTVKATAFEGDGSALTGVNDDWTIAGNDIYKANTGNVGIGTTSPDALVDIEGGAFLAQGTTGSTPVSGAGTRMMWIPDKKAFRAGQVNGSQWDDGNIGQGSFVGGGESNTASGTYSFVGGGGSHTASGFSSFIGGGSSGIASNDYSFVGGGESHIASGLRSFVGGGLLNEASGSDSFVGGGQDNTASGFSSFVGGASSSIASNDFSFVGGGFLNSASGKNSFVGGGYRLSARSYAEAVFGHYNTDYTPFSPNGINLADRLFVIGNGTSLSARSNAMTVLKNGNVGIGIDIPTQKVDVVGTVKATAFEGDGSALIGVNDDWTIAGNDIYNANSGNVGIGTTSPNSKLSISPSAVEAKITLYDGGSTTDHYGLGISGSQFNYHTSTSSADHVFYAGGKNGDGNELIRIKGNGNVGIGTSNPLGKLSLTNTNVSTVDLLFRTDDGTLGNTNWNTARIQAGWETGETDWSDAFLKFENPTASNTYSTTMALKGGYVGIGESNPGSKLHVKHGGFGFRLQHSSEPSNWWELFHSNGDNRYELWYTNALKGYFDPSSGAYSSTSDRNLKDNISSLHSVLPSLMQLQAKKYTYKSDTENEEHLGFIAQEVELLFPQLVSKPSDDGERERPYLMNYAGFGVLAIKAIQEQQAVIIQQQSEIDLLHSKLSKLDDLEKRLAQLENALLPSNESKNISVKK